MKDMLLFLAGIIIVGLVIAKTTNVFPRFSNSAGMKLKMSKDGTTCTLSGPVSGFGMATNVVSASGVPMLVCQGSFSKPASQKDVDGAVNCGAHGNGTVSVSDANHFTVKCI
jgi:hypothetical protein